MLYCLQIIVYTIFILHSSLWGNKISIQYVKNTHEPQKIFTQIQKASRSKTLPCSIYYAAAKKNYLAYYLKKALWLISQCNISHIKNPSSRLQVLTLKGQIFSSMNRLEESIHILKKVVFNNKKSVVVREIKIKQQAHLHLIHSYFKKHQTKKNRDIKYLAFLFNNWYHKTYYANILEDWLRTPK